MSFFAIPGIISQGGAAWTPASLSPEGWWRADLGHAYADTDPVAAWANQGTAGSSGNLAQGTGGLRPTYDASHASFNGQAVMDFGAAAAVIYAAAGTWWHLSSESSSCVLLAVCRTTSASGFEEVAITRAYTTVGGLALRIRAASSCSFNVEESGGVTAIADSGANGVQNQVHVLAGVLTGAVTTAADSAACWVDGVSGAASTADLDAPVAASSDREFLLGGVTTSAGSLNGQIAEVIFIKRVLTSGEDASLTGYLNTRYGLALSGVTQ